MQPETTSPPSSRTRRTEGTRVRGRAERVVSSVLAATQEELGRVGYSALRIEDVAERSGVNKTTIYRRWPTKADLVAASLRAVSDEHELPDTGTLRGDLLAMVMNTAHIARTPTGRGIVRMLETERADPELEALAKTVRERGRQRNKTLLERGVARGELPADVSLDLVLELILAFVYVRLVRHAEDISEDHAAAVIDTVLAGARTGAARLPPERNSTGDRTQKEQP